MRKIDKSIDNLLSTKYKQWLNKSTADGNVPDGTNRYYYDDVAMNLYNCQSGVCAYTEMFICPMELYSETNWIEGKYKIADTTEYKRIDHLGEMDHFDAAGKKLNYWNWDNLFMIHAKINSIKTDRDTISYLKPDIAGYSPEKYFDYDGQTHRFIPNTEIDDPAMVDEIRDMIDNVLCLNHGVVRNERRDYINGLKDKQKRGEALIIDRFFTSVNWALSE